LKYIEIFVKTALSKSGLENTDYSLNPYRGCEHQCVYCYAPYVTHTPLEIWRTTVFIKKNIPTVLDKELRRKKGFITIGSVTDAYQPAERKYELTRKSLEVLLKHRGRISILTKSNLILRDIDIIEKFEEAHVGVTLTTLSDEKRRLMEPNSSSIEERLDVLENFRGKAITYAFIGPIIPSITMPYLESMLKILRNIGVDYIIFDRFRWKKNMVLPENLEKEIRNTNYWEIKRKIYRGVKSLEIPIYFDW